MAESYTISERDNKTYVVSKAKVNGNEGTYAFTGIKEDGKLIITGIQNVDEYGHIVGKATESPIIGLTTGKGKITTNENGITQSVEFKRALEGEIRIPSFKASPPESFIGLTGILEPIDVPDTAINERGSARAIKGRPVSEIPLTAMNQNGEATIRLVGNIPEEEDRVDPKTKRRVSTFVVQAVDVLNKDGKVIETISLSKDQTLKMKITETQGNPKIDLGAYQMKIQDLLNGESLSNSVKKAIDSESKPTPKKNADRSSLGELSPPNLVGVIPGGKSGGRFA